jgi:hypothetical protein
MKEFPMSQNTDHLTREIIANIGHTPGDFRRLINDAEERALAKFPYGKEQIAEARKIINLIPRYVEAWIEENLSREILLKKAQEGSQDLGPVILDIPMTDFATRPSSTQIPSREDLKRGSTTALVYDYCTLPAVGLKLEFMPYSCEGGRKTGVELRICPDVANGNSVLHALPVVAEVRISSLE